MLRYLGANCKKILRLSYDVIITYDDRKLLSHSKIILRFFVISPLGLTLRIVPLVVRPVKNFGVEEVVVVWIHRLDGLSAIL